MLPHCTGQESKDNQQMQINVHYTVDRSMGCTFVKQSSQEYRALKKWKCRVNMSRALAGDQGELIFHFSIKRRFCGRTTKQCAWLMCLKCACSLLRCQFPGFSRLLLSDEPPLKNTYLIMALWLLNILFDFCFMVFLTEPYFNCLFCAPRAWVVREGFINEMIIVIPSFLSALS